MHVCGGTVQSVDEEWEVQNWCAFKHGVIFDIDQKSKNQIT